jgi:uncharacterized cupredoxin-like copper-binding protein
VKLAIAPFLILALVIGALVSGGAEASNPTVRVTLDEWTLTAEQPTVRAGRVTFDSANTGRTDHELLVVRTELRPEEIRDPRFAGVYVLGAPHSHLDKLDGLRSRHIAPQRTRRDVVDLAPGKYVLFCGLPGHLRNGQRAALRVTG